MKLSFEPIARRTLLASAASTLLSVAGHAQSTGNNPKAGASGEQLQEITVTVARQTRNLQKVPAAIQVISGARIAQQAQTNIAQIVANVPSVQATAQPAGYSIDIRGLGGDNPSGYTQGAVALELDGVYNVLSPGTTIGFFDLDRLEILPGPQSTQYGPNAEGGVVDVVTKAPVIGSTSGYGLITLGNYGLVRVEAAQNIPINDVFAARIAVTGINRDSYFKPATGNNVGEGVRAKLLYSPTADLTAKLSYEIDHIAGTGPGFEGVGGPPTLYSQVGVPVPGGVPCGPGNSLTCGGYAQYAGGSINNYSNPWALGQYTIGKGATFSDSQSRLYQNQVSLDVNDKIGDWIEAEELAAFIDIVGSGTNCVGEPPTFGYIGIPSAATSCTKVLPFFPYHAYSSETRLHNAAGSLIQWNVGFYHWSYTYASQPANVPLYSDGFTRTTTNAVFGQATYPITSSLRVTGGVRESFDERTRNQSNYPQVLPDASVNFSHFDYTAGVEYDLTKSSMEYAKVTTGYRPGTVNYDGVTQSNEIQPNETNTAFEVGSKNRLFDNTLQLNADVFYYIQRGYQLPDPYGGFFAADGTLCQNGTTDVECNLPPQSLRAHEYGLEAQARWNITPNDQISDTLTALNAVFDKSQSGCPTLGVPAEQLAQGGCYDGYNLSNQLAPLFFNIAGASQPHSPHFATTVDYTHTFNFRFGTFRLGGEVFFSSSYFAHPVENVYSVQPSYFQEALNADFTPTQGRWSVSAYARNLSDYAVKQSALPTVTIGDPRTFGFTLNYKW